MPPRRRHAWVGFAAVAVVAVYGVFVLDGAASGPVLLAALVGFIAACIYALKGEDRDTVARADRTGLSGWFWF